MAFDFHFFLLGGGGGGGGWIQVPLFFKIRHFLLKKNRLGVDLILFITLLLKES